MHLATKGDSIDRIPEFKSNVSGSKIVGSAKVRKRNAKIKREETGEMDGGRACNHFFK